MEKVILLVGPTGVGKTSASLLIARSLHTEIISSDSMQIYRRMDIGTAKPTPEERRSVRHHMIDIAEPWEYTARANRYGRYRVSFPHSTEKGKFPSWWEGQGSTSRR